MSRRRKRAKYLKVHPIVRQIIDRDCHVSLSNRSVIRHVISRLRDGRATFRAITLGDRKNLMRQCIKVHRENREFYVDLMSGDVSGRLRRKRENAAGEA